MFYRPVYLPGAPQQNHHVLGQGKSAEHSYTSAARLVGGVLTYAAL